MSSTQKHLEIPELFIQALQNEVLSAAEQAAFEALKASSPEYQKMWAELKVLQTELKDLPQSSPSFQASELTRSRILQSAKQAISSSTQQRELQGDKPVHTWFKPFMAIAASLLMVLGLTYFSGYFSENKEDSQQYAMHFKEDLEGKQASPPQPQPSPMQETHQERENIAIPEEKRAAQVQVIPSSREKHEKNLKDFEKTDAKKPRSFHAKSLAQEERPESSSLKSPGFAAKKLDSSLGKSKPVKTMAPQEAPKKEDRAKAPSLAQASAGSLKPPAMPSKTSALSNKRLIAKVTHSREKLIDSAKKDMKAKRYTEAYAKLLRAKKIQDSEKLRKLIQICRAKLKEQKEKQKEAQKKSQVNKDAESSKTLPDDAP